MDACTGSTNRRPRPRCAATVSPSSASKAWFFHPCIFGRCMVPNGCRCRRRRSSKYASKPLWPECSGPLAVPPLLQATRHGRPSTNQAAPALGEALAAAARELGHAALAPLPRRACSRCAAGWPAAAASPPWPVATARPPWPAAAAPPSAPYRDSPPPLKPGSTLEGVDPSIPVSGVPSLRAAAAGRRRGFMAARRLLRAGERAFRGEGGGDLVSFFLGRGEWSRVVGLGWQNHGNFGEL
jgi:hypothetical protein